MEAINIRNLSFTYPNSEKAAIDNLSLSIEQGSFVCLCGPSGCGKTTVLRNLKPSITPHGMRKGRIEIMGEHVDDLGMDPGREAQTVGYVLQNPENQIVTDKVWHELAFGLENLGLATETIRLRIAEIASFFGIQNWFGKDVFELSGGQKQLLNLAAVMVMQPEILILDEPTSQLDPIAASDFLDAVKKINSDIGTTVIITEHRLDNVVSMADRLIVMEEGRIVENGKPHDVVKALSSGQQNMFLAMPAPAQAFKLTGDVLGGEECEEYEEIPLNVREGRKWLDHIFKGRRVGTTRIREKNLTSGDFDRFDGSSREKGKEVKVSTKDLWFRYEKEGNDVIKGLRMEVYDGEILAVIGGNGTGKTTLLSVLAGLRKPYRGKIKVASEHRAMLPQNPQSLFVTETVREELLEAFEGTSVGKSFRTQKITEMAEFLEIDHLMEHHPYDISGGEQQRLALGKVLLLEPDLLLLDEPTKGMDNLLKMKLGELLRELRKQGRTIIFVSHDIEFCSRFSDRCLMFFDGMVSGEGTPRKLFSGNNFYTTAANRMARNYFVDGILPEDIAWLVSENLKGGSYDRPSGDGGKDFMGTDKNDGAASDENGDETDGDDGDDLYDFEDVEDLNVKEVGAPKGGKVKEIHQSKRATVLTLVTAGVMALTIYAGYRFGGERAYYVVSFLVAIYSLVPFFVGFERKKPQIREIVVIAVLIALGVAGREAFFMAPQVKPIIAIAIIGGASLGPGAGFLIGSMIAFVSNFLFGQGPWTPWQMMAVGVAGMFAGVLFQKINRENKRPVKWHKTSVCVFGLFMGYVYGLIVDLWTLFGYTQKPNWEAYLVVKSTAVWFDTVLAISTFVFLWILYTPMIKKLNRIKLKYGMD